LSAHCIEVIIGDVYQRILSTHDPSTVSNWARPVFWSVIIASSFGCRFSVYV